MSHDRICGHRGVSVRSVAGVQRDRTIHNPHGKFRRCRPVKAARAWRTGVLALFSLLLILMLVVAATGPAVPAAARELRVRGKAAALVDRETGQVLYALNERESLPMASTTKIMTAVVALERGRPGDRVTVPPEATRVAGSRIFLEAGETYTLDEMLYALLVASANDAAIAIAVYVGGSVEGFVNLMNEKAQELGLSDTSFANPHGLDAPGHFTSALDLARLAAYAMEDPDFRRYAATRSVDIPWPVKGSVRTLNSGNLLLTGFEGATGIKTGFTSQAGYCLAGSARQGDREVVAVILGASRETIWTDMSGLLRYGLEGFERRRVVDGNQTVLVPVEGVEDLLPAAPAEEFFVLVPAGGSSPVEVVTDVPASLQPPIMAGDRVGTVTVRQGTEVLAEIPLLAQKGIRFTGSQLFRRWLVLMVLAVAAVYWLARRRARRRRAYQRWRRLLPRP